MKHVIGILSPKVTEVVLEELKRISDRLDTTWITVVADSLKRNAALRGALDLTRRSMEGISSIHLWLDELQVDIPAAAPINSTSELSQTLRKLNMLKNRIDAKTSEYRSVVDSG